MMILSPQRTRLVTWTLLLFLPIIGMAVDLVAPSLPAIANALQASHKLTKDIISVYLLGYALGNFIIGLLADAWGRKPLIRSALILFILSSALPLLYPTIGIILTARLLQGFALGAVAVLMRAIFSDILEPKSLAKLGPLMGTFWGLGPVLGPVIA